MPPDANTWKIIKFVCAGRKPTEAETSVTCVVLQTYLVILISSLSLTSFPKVQGKQISGGDFYRTRLGL